MKMLMGLTGTAVAMGCVAYGADKSERLIDMAIGAGLADEVRGVAIMTIDAQHFEGPSSLDCVVVSAGHGGCTSLVSFPGEDEVLSGRFLYVFDAEGNIVGTDPESGETVTFDMVSMRVVDFDPENLAAGAQAAAQ